MAEAYALFFLPIVLSMFLLSRWSGGLVERYGARLPLIAGPLLAACSFALPAGARQALAEGRNRLAALEVPAGLDAAQREAVRDDL